jgi:hypothetical protein
VGYVISCELDVHLKVELYDMQNRMPLAPLVIEGMIPQKIFAIIKDDQGAIIPEDQVKKLYSKLQANGVIGPDGFLLPLRKPYNPSKEFEFSEKDVKLGSDFQRYESGVFEAIKKKMNGFRWNTHRIKLQNGRNNLKFLCSPTNPGEFSC